jgi:hypothetical protein
MTASTRAMLGVAATATAVAAAAYLRFLRPHVLNWGATREEAERSMPGDNILTDASVQTTRAVTINTPPAAIWPWLVQMGPRPRAGAYTYDWIERLLGIDIENTNRILPEYQHLEVGETTALNKKGQGIIVREVQPEQFLVLQWIPARSTWTFGLYPEDGGTRLISRNRLAGTGPTFWLPMIAFMEPGSLIMERKMLQGIKQRAELLASASASQPPAEQRQTVSPVRRLANASRIPGESKRH